MNIALILAGGTGTRLQADVPKQYLEIKGKPIISYCLDGFERDNQVERIQIVADKNYHSYIQKWTGQKFVGFSKPGENRQLSILSGLEDISKYASSEDTVIVQDAARPILNPKLIDQALKEMNLHDGVMPVLPMKETVYMSTDGKKITALLDRNQIFAGQAPEFFVLGKYLKACKNLLPDKIKSIKGSTEPAVLYGMNIAMIPGDEDNFKITTQTDLDRFKRYLEMKDKEKK